jgi:hypothetical protein
MFVAALLIGCQPRITVEQEQCGRAAEMYRMCESFKGQTPLERDLEIDRWRGLCRALLTKGDTDNLAHSTVELYQSLDDPQREALAEQARCTAETTTCRAYAACSK